MAGNFECFHCLSGGVVWDSDFGYEDYGYNGEGIVHVLHCTECGARIEYRVPLGGSDDAEEDGRVGGGRGQRGLDARGREDDALGQEEQGGSKVEQRVVAGAQDGGSVRHGEVRAGEEGVERPRWWVFTFGCGHKHAGHYIRIFGTFSEARTEMVDRYGRQWAFQYSEDEWERTVRIMECMDWPVETELKEEDHEEG